MFFAWACYEDKGNYDYREINQITIQGIDTLIRCDQMDLLSIPVTLEGTQYADTNRFSYLWEVNREAVATTKDLNIYANFPLGENTGRFIVTDKDLGTKAFWNYLNGVIKELHERAQVAEQTGRTHRPRGVVKEILTGGIKLAIFKHP